MRRIILVLSLTALMAAMLVASAVPALTRDRDRFDDLDRFDGFVFFDDDFDGFGRGPTSLGMENDADSGDVTMHSSVSNEGDFASQCTPTLQFGNTGNLNNSPSVLQFGSDLDDFESDGTEFVTQPTVDTQCDQTVQQSAAASG